LTLRCGDLPHVERSKLLFTRILVIIPGPSEPKNLEPYLQDTLSAFKSFAPEQGGLLVKEHKVEDGRVVVREVHHKMLLGAVFGDSPGIKKLASWLSHASYFGCGYCLLKGTYEHGAMRYLGYLADQPTHTGFGADLAFWGMSM
jgi:hypothetical protein